MELFIPTNRADILVATVAFALGLLTLVHLRQLLVWRACTRGLPLPPGPRPLPIVGNLFDMPKVRAWEGFRELAAKYGAWYAIPLSHLNVLGNA